jgi:hypothetical protein
VYADAGYIRARSARLRIGGHIAGKHVGIKPRLKGEIKGGPIIFRTSRRPCAQAQITRSVSSRLPKGAFYTHSQGQHANLDSVRAQQCMVCSRSARYG